MKNKKGKLFIISGPSGVGKTTIRKRIIENNNNFKYSISMTTRKPRIDETTNKFEENGKEYYFVSKEEFNNNIKLDNFLEYQEVYKDIFYGTLKSEVLSNLNNGYNVILEIDVDGALQIKEKYNDAILIFIKPQSFEQLEERLKKRKTDNLDKIKERLEKSNYEISKSKYYEHIFITKTKDEDYNNIMNIINRY